MTPPLIIERRRCLRCRQRGSIEFYYDEEQGRFFTEAPCSCIWEEPGPLAGFLPQPAGGEGPWSPFIFWGGRPGYAVGPEGAIPLVTGWKFAAPYGPAEYHHVLGESDGVYVALRLTESEWVWWNHPTHLACGEELGDVEPSSWLRDRLFVGTRSSRYQVVVFRSLKPVSH